MGGAADAGGVDSGGYAALGGDVGGGFDADAVLFAETLPEAAGKMFCDECIGAVEGIDFACLQIQEVEQEGFGGAAGYRDDCGAVEGGGFDSAAITASDGRTGDAGGKDAAGGSGGSTGSGKTLRGLRGEQENDSASVSGRDEDEFWKVAAATAAVAWIAIDGVGGEGDGGGVGGRV